MHLAHCLVILSTYLIIVEFRGLGCRESRGWEPRIARRAAHHTEDASPSPGLRPPSPTRGEGTDDVAAALAEIPIATFRQRSEIHRAVHNGEDHDAAGARFVDDAVVVEDNFSKLGDAELGNSSSRRAASAILRANWGAYSGESSAMYAVMSARCWRARGVQVIPANDSGPP